MCPICWHLIRQRKGPIWPDHSAVGTWGREAGHPSVHVCPVSPVCFGAAFILGSFRQHSRQPSTPRVRGAFLGHRSRQVCSTSASAAGNCAHQLRWARARASRAASRYDNCSACVLRPRDRPPCHGQSAPSVSTPPRMGWGTHGCWRRSPTKGLQFGEPRFKMCYLFSCRQLSSCDCFLQ